MSVQLAAEAPLSCILFILLLGPILVDAVTVSPADLRAARHFASAHFGCPAAGAEHSFDPAFSFRLGGRHSTGLLQAWACSETHLDGDGGAQLRSITFSDPASKLAVTVNVTSFRDAPATEWVLSFRNAGAEATPALTAVAAADVEFAAGISTFELTHALAYGEGIPSDQFAGGEVIRTTPCIVPQ